MEATKGFKHTTDKPDGQFYDESVDVYELIMQLPDDGCPNSEQYLRVRVIISDGRATISLDVFTSGGEKRKHLGSFDADRLEAVACMLYGAARLVTVKEIRPV